VMKGIFAFLGRFVRRFVASDVERPVRSCRNWVSLARRCCELRKFNPEIKLFNPEGSSVLFVVSIA
jgi:hypothetical protein